MGSASALEAKQQTVGEIKAKMESAKTIVLTDYRGLNVSEMTKLRSQLRKAGVEYKIVKNTLTRIAATDLGLEGLNEYLEGPTAIAISIEDPVAPAKILSDFAAANKNLEIKGGVIEGKVIGFDGVKALADLPPREVLLAKVLGGMQAPLVGMANVLQGPIRNFVYVIDAVRKQKEA